MSLKFTDWVSLKFYINNKSKRAYVINEKTCELFMFEDITAELLNKLYINDEKSLLNFIKENEIENEIDEFVSLLISLGVMSDSSSINDLKQDETIKNITSKTESTEALNEMTDRVASNGYLPGLFIELTYNCNLKCIHCFNDKNDIRTEITFESIKNIIDEADKLGAYKVTLSGGESTIAKDFLKIAKYIREKKMQLIVYTNGQTLVDDKFFNEVLNLYPHRIDISLYSMNSDIHDKITGVKGSFDKTLQTILKLKKNNINTLIKCFICNLNANSYKSVIQFAKENGISYAVDDIFLDNKNRNNTSIQITEEQLLKIYTDKESDFYIKKEVNRGKNKCANDSICKAGLFLVSIAPNLDVYPCTSFKFKLGNLKEESLTEIFKCHNEKSKLKYFRELKIKDLKDCYKEEYCRFCTYCPSRPTIEGNFLGKSDVLCKIAKIKMKADKIADEKNI